MKRPSFQFYPADWKTNANLRRCSEAARGVWMDILCVLHDSDEYGVARWPLAELARVAGVALKLARELADKSVLKGADKGPVNFVHTPRHAGRDGDPVTLIDAVGPCWFSSRMVKDEWRRSVSGGQTRFSANNQTVEGGTADRPPRRSPSQRHGDDLGDGASTSSSSSLFPSETDLAREKKFILPEWVPSEPWADFLEMRKKIKAVPTQKAIKMLVTELETFRAEGQDIAAVLNQSTKKNWRGLFRVKADFAAQVASSAFEPTTDEGWRGRCQAYQKHGQWLEKWGPPLGAPGCKIPAAIQQQIRQQQDAA